MSYSCHKRKRKQLLELFLCFLVINVSEKRFSVHGVKFGKVPVVTGRDFFCSHSRSASVCHTRTHTLSSPKKNDSGAKKTKKLLNRLNYFPEPVIKNSVLRFCARPSSVSLLATGEESP